MEVEQDKLGLPQEMVVILSCLKSSTENKGRGILGSATEY